MTTFQLLLLGTNAALPRPDRFTAAQVLTVGGRNYLIDCGEGTIIRLQQLGVRPGRLHQVFISHLHGDHCFGLAGVLSSMALGGRRQPLDVYSPPGLEAMIKGQLHWIDDASGGFPVHFHVLDPTVHARIFENADLEVFSLPLHHRVPCCGFLFREKNRPRNLRRAAIHAYQLSVPQIQAIKAGADLQLPSGAVVANDQLTVPAAPPRSYAYCSDTAYWPPLAAWIHGVDLLYHESTFCERDALRAEQTGHSTARQAGQLAQTAGAKRLVLGHFSLRYGSVEPFAREAAEVFPAVILGHDGLLIPVPGEPQRLPL